MTENVCSDYPDISFGEFDRTRMEGEKEGNRKRKSWKKGDRNPDLKGNDSIRRSDEYEETGEEWEKEEEEEEEKQQNRKTKRKTAK